MDLTFTSEALKAIAHLALERKTGARGLRAIVETILLDPMFEIPGSDVTSVHITEGVVKGHFNPIYTRTPSTNRAPTDSTEGNHCNSHAGTNDDEEIELKRRL